jgi:ADP-ribose pyrophosphatase YjhB (NUDIX family)
MHTLGAVAVVVHDGQVLLIRRSDLPVWALPGGGLEAGETLKACCLREAKEETGLDVEIERLAGLYARQRALGRPMDLTFVFTCRVVGGALGISDETTAVRYWPTQRLPFNMPGWHRLYLADALDGHRAPRWRTLPPPLLAILVARTVLGLRRLAHRLRGRPKYRATRWNLGAFVTLFDGDGRVLLVLRRDFPVWNLPGGGVEWNETPWEAAVREAREETGLEVEIRRLTGVYHKPSRGAVVLNFEGQVVAGRPVPTDEGAESRYFPVDALPEPTLPKHVERIRDSAAREADAVFRIQDTPPGLKELGYEPANQQF